MSHKSGEGEEAADTEMCTSGINRSGRFIREEAKTSDFCLGRGSTH